MRELRGPAAPGLGGRPALQSGSLLSSALAGLSVVAALQTRVPPPPPPHLLSGRYPVDLCMCVCVCVHECMCVCVCVYVCAHHVV